MADVEARADAFRMRHDHALERLRERALRIGGAALVASLIGALFAQEQFFRSYLVAYMLWLGVALGSMGIVMIHHITGGRWGAVLRRPLEAAGRTVPLMAVLFVPIVFGMHDLYHWTHAEAVAHDPVLQHKAPYLNVPFFLARALFYFVVWTVLAVLLARWSAEQDEGHTAAVGRKLHFLSRGGLLLYAMTMTFASIDWVMSTDPHWFSHIYGVIFTGGQILTAMAVMIPVAALIAADEPFDRILTPDRFHDLGKLLLAFIMLWAYFALSQYLIIWSGNLPEEAPWYIRRLSGGWQYVGSGLILVHFIAPFVVLLSRSVKRQPRLLARVAGVLLLARFLDLHWLVTPTFFPGELHFHWLDVTTALGLGGLWFWFFVGQLRERPLVPLCAPEIVDEVRA